MKNILFLILAFSLSYSQDLPTAKSIAAEMGAGWNLGNTMEAPGSPTNWGNVVPTQAFIDSVKKAGFKNIRIPCAWDGYANQSTLVIDPNWMALVKQVVDFCIKDSLFVTLNIHWDGGWLENRIDSAVTRPTMLNAIKAKQGAYWKQIATTFRNYDRHLLFASTNEPGVESVEAQAVLHSLHQIFIDTVRATGGNNHSRTLILAAPSTSFEKAYNWMSMPNDVIADRLMVDAHFYPYQFCLMSRDATWGKPFYYWGQGNHSPTDITHNPTWGEEAFVDSQFTLVQTKFVNRNIPVMVGEFGAMKRLTLTGDNLLRHVRSRRAFYNYTVRAARNRGMVPVVWDAGGLGDGTMSVFYRKPGKNHQAGSIYDLGLLNAIRDGAGLAKLPGDTSLARVVTGSNSMKIYFSAKDSSSSQVGLGIIRPDMSTVDSVYLRAFVKGTTQYDSMGVTKNASLSMSLVTMSQNWTWREASLGAVVRDAWKTYGIPVSTNINQAGALVPADPANIDVLNLQFYSHGYRGAIYFDWIIFKNKNGTRDTVYAFDQYIPEEGSNNIDEVVPIATSLVPTDNDWLTETTTIWSSSTPVLANTVPSRSLHQVISLAGGLEVQWHSPHAERTWIVVRDLHGRVLSRSEVQSQIGQNTVHIQSIPPGAGVISVIHAQGQWSQVFVAQ